MKVEWIRIPGRPHSAQGKSKKKHMELIAKCARQHFQKPWNGELSIQIFYVLNRNTGFTPDLDNLDKLVLDALKAVAYVDDGQIQSRKSELHYCGERLVSSALIMPPANPLQKAAEIQKQECTFVGVTDIRL